MDERVSWDEYFMNVARVVATRATCDRKHVGAVLVRDKTILSTGYNGSIRGLPHCTEVGHMMEDGHCVATVHAEGNAIIQAAKNGVAIEGATCYTTASPCWPCFKLIANGGCRRIVFGEFYRDARIFEFAQKLGIELVELEVPPRPDVQPADTGHPKKVTSAARGPAAGSKLRVSGEAPFGKLRVSGEAPFGKLRVSGEAKSAGKRGPRKAPGAKARRR